MNNDEYEAQKKRYEELLAKYRSDVPMNAREIMEFVELREMYESVEE